MVLSPQTGRNWKLFTYVACSATTFYSVFYATYNPHDPREHCFTEVCMGISAWVCWVRGRVYWWKCGDMGVTVAVATSCTPAMVVEADMRPCWRALLLRSPVTSVIMSIWCTAGASTSDIQALSNPFLCTRSKDGTIPT